MILGKVKQLQPNYFEFNMNKKLKGPFTIYLENDDTFIGEFDKHEFNAKVEIPLYERPYFRVKSTEITFTVAERTLPVEGMNNFRDMGGYKTVSGKTVKWGRLYRSDHLWNATEDGIEYLKRLNLGTIIDYRSDDEIEKYPNHHLDPEVKTYVLDPNAHAAELSAQFSSSKQDEDINLIKKITEQKEKGVLQSQYDIILKQYKNFVHHIDSKRVFAEMLEIASRDGADPLLQHCRGGKDRTGFGVLLILGVLGVPKDVLVYDYMLTKENRIERNEKKMKGYRELTNDPEVLNYLYSLIETREDFIITSIDEMEKEFESIENYVTKELNISQEIINKLKEKYLE